MNDKLNYELTPGPFRNEKEIYTYQVTLRVTVLCHCVTIKIKDFSRGVLELTPIHGRRRSGRQKKTTMEERVPP